MEGFIDAGFEHLEPLLYFRNWLAAIRNDRSRRLKERRNGLVSLMSDGSPVPGPFTIDTRREILKRLLEAQDEVNLPLISTAEIERINEIWAEDIMIDARRALKAVRTAQGDAP